MRIFVCVMMLVCLAGCQSQETFYTKKDLEWPKQELVRNGVVPGEKPYLPPTKNYMDRRHPYEASVTFSHIDDDGLPVFVAKPGYEMSMWYCSSKQAEIVSPADIDQVQIRSWAENTLERVKNEPISSHEFGLTIYVLNAGTWTWVNRKKLYEEYIAYRQAVNAERRRLMEPPNYMRPHRLELTPRYGRR